MKQSKHNPPQIAKWVLNWFCRGSFIEDLQGDLDEIFYTNLKIMSPLKAKLRYCGQVLSLLSSYAIRRRKQQASHHPFSTQSTLNLAMLKSYFTIAVRNLVKHKFFTIINVAGLSIGMSISLLIIAMLSFISTYDNFHEHKDSLYRIITFTDDKQSNREFASAPSLIKDKLENNSAIASIIRINSNLQGEVGEKGKEITISGYYVDPKFLDVFSFPLIKGNPNTVLSDPNSVIITEKASLKIFGDIDPLGQIIHLKDRDFLVTGVLRDIPRNSHMQFEIIAPYEALLQNNKYDNLQPDEWLEFRNSYIYLQIPDGNSLDQINNHLQKIASQSYSTSHNFKASFELQPMLEIAPGRELYNQIGPDWGYASLSIFGLLTLLILLPACFNYANISISRSLKRMKEIGLRKVMGGQRSHIFIQFITETVLISVASLALSYYFFTLIKTEFLNMLVDSEALNLDPGIRTIMLFILFAILVGFAAGVVPALYFSKLNPVQALKSKILDKLSGKFSIRKTITIMQFALSVGFIMGVVIVFSQYRQSLHHNFGFTQENILDVELQGVQPHIIRNEFGKLPDVQNISMSSHVIGTTAPETEWIQMENSEDSTIVSQMYVDENYIPNLNLELLAGENFKDSDYGKSMIVNEEFINQQNIKDASSAIGKTFVINDSIDLMIIGVVKNFHYAHLREPIGSFCFRYNPSKWNIANVKIAGSRDIAQTISGLEATWRTFGGENKFEAQFLKDEIKDAYSFYFSMIKICSLLGLLAISISCLGLLGMVVFTVENRIKEIGIRRVMGASAMHITYILSWDFIKLLLIAGTIATPVTYFLIEKYLERQMYKLDMGVWEGTVSLLIMLLLGLATIFSQTFKAAKANPVDTLRNE